MGKKCAAYGCRGNYKGEPYSPVVKFPKDPDTREEWIQAMPNNRSELENRKDIWICRRHFDCPFEKTQGGVRPTCPPNLFDGINKSCLKQIKSKPRPTKLSSSENRRLAQETIEKERDMIIDFKSFLEELPKRFSDFYVKSIDNGIVMFKTDSFDKQIAIHLHFQEVSTPFGFLKLHSVEKFGMELSKLTVGIPKSDLVHRWSQMNTLITSVQLYEPTIEDHWKKAAIILHDMHSLLYSPTFSFLIEQFNLLITKKQGRRYNKHILLLAAEILNISPSAYRMLRRSESIILPSERLIRKLLSSSFQDNLDKIMEKLSPEQRLVNILFDEIKLKEATRFVGGHIIGHANDKEGELAKSALVYELICHHGGPRYILRIDPVAGINGEQLKDRLVEVCYKVKQKGAIPIVLISDNCAVNRRAYKLLGGPGEVKVQPDGFSIFLSHDYDHIFKNIRNNWITEPTKELRFVMDDKNYIACWKDIENLYNEDRSNAVRLTRLNYISVNPKPLQRQSIDLVCQVFNEKTSAALVAAKAKLNISQGTINFINLIYQWYKMMNIKSKHSHTRLNDNFRMPWVPNCESFRKLLTICNIIETCKWPSTKGREKKLTKYTAEAFIVTTKTNINAAKRLHENHDFKYILPAVFSQSPLEKFFGQARQRKGGNFYIDICDVIAASKVQRLHQLIKYDVDLEKKGGGFNCEFCDIEPIQTDLENVSDLSITDTQTLICSNDILKEKVVYLAGYLMFKDVDRDNVDDDEEVSTDFLNELNRGFLRIPTLNMVFLVHSTMLLYDKVKEPYRRCTKYVAKLLSYVDTPFSDNNNICKRLTNLVFKADVLHRSDTEKDYGCLRRKEKLSK